MEVAFNSREVLHLSVSPSFKSWSIFVGIISIGLGACCYTPDENPLIKIASLGGCVFLALTFLEDWEDCVIDKNQNKITLTRKNWFDTLTSHCSDSKTLIMDTSSVMQVKVFKRESDYKVELVLTNGNLIPISETSSGSKSHQDHIAECIKKHLCLDRIEAIKEFWDFVDNYEATPSSPLQVESLRWREKKESDDEESHSDRNFVPFDGLDEFDEVDEVDADDSDSFSSSTEEEFPYHGL